VAFVLFMMCLELLVAFLQAYIFALLTSVFIGLMQHEH
jgi:F-type H+-transporting ATPase subunit a